MFPEPAELLVWKNQFGPQDSNQIQWHQKPTRSHTDKGKLHTWWVEPSFAFVQHQPFQLHQQRQSDIEKNTRRCRWRKSHSKIKAGDEFGIEMPCKGSDRICLDCIWKPGRHQIWKSELVKCAANEYGETCEWNNQPVCSLSTQTSWSSTLIWTLPLSQNRTFL